MTSPDPWEIYKHTWERCGYTCRRIPEHALYPGTPEQVRITLPDGYLDLDRATYDDVADEAFAAILGRARETWQARTGSVA